MPENDDPNAVSDEEYWAQYELFKAAHPDGLHQIPVDQYRVYDEVDS